MILLIIVSIFNLLLAGLLAYLFYVFTKLKVAFDDLILNMLKNHKQMMEAEKQTNKDVMNNYELTNKSIKDINNIRVSINTFKELLKDLNTTDRALTDTAKNQEEVNKHSIALTKKLEEITVKLNKSASDLKKT
jgi:septal ring factor EnvC (AmiA/AmiB activator)